METTIKLLQSYSGRDKIMRTAGYVSLMLAGAADGRAAKNLGTVSRQISATRTVLRLFDDLPMLAHTLSYGTGTKEKDIITRILTLVGNVTGLVFFPIEHIAWAAENQILRIHSKPWWNASIVCWVVMLITGLMKSLRSILILRYRRARLLKQKKLESPDKGDASSTSYTQGMRDLAMQEQTEFLLLIKNSADFLNAIHFLPSGILWSGRLNTTQCGLFGTIASVAGLAVLLRTK